MASRTSRNAFAMAAWYPSAASFVRESARSTPPRHARLEARGGAAPRHPRQRTLLAHPRLAQRRDGRFRSTQVRLDLAKLQLRDDAGVEAQLLQLQRLAPALEGARELVETPV